MTEKHSILVVDDEKQNRALLSELLKEDHQIFLAKNGVQALERAREHLPDLIMLDVLIVWLVWVRFLAGRSLIPSLAS